MEKMNSLYVPKDISDELTPYQRDRRVVVKGIIGGIGIAALGGIELVLDGCAAMPEAPPVPLTEGMPNTLTYVNDKGEKETVPDLRGIWDITIHEDGGIYYQMERFEQDKNKFSGFKYKSGIIITAGMESVKGILEPNKTSFKELYFREPHPDRWEKAEGVIYPSLNKMFMKDSIASVHYKRKK